MIVLLFVFIDVIEVVVKLGTVPDQAALADALTARHLLAVDQPGERAARDAEIGGSLVAGQATRPACIELHLSSPRSVLNLPLQQADMLDRHLPPHNLKHFLSTTFFNLWIKLTHA
jgi:hypothetical protein